MQNSVCRPKRGTATRLHLLRRTFSWRLFNAVPRKAFSCAETGNLSFLPVLLSAPPVPGTSPSDAGLPRRSVTCLLSLQRSTEPQTQELRTMSHAHLPPFLRVRNSQLLTARPSARTGQQASPGRTRRPSPRSHTRHTRHFRQLPGRGSHQSSPRLRGGEGVSTSRGSENLQTRFTRPRPPSPWPFLFNPG